MEEDNFDNIPDEGGAVTELPPKSELTLQNHIETLANKKTISAKTQLAEYEQLRDAMAEGPKWGNKSSMEASQYVQSIPRSKITWVKALWNNAHKRHYISAGDYNGLKNIYMNQPALASIVKAFEAIRGVKLNTGPSISVPYFKNQAKGPPYKFKRDKQGNLQPPEILVANPGVYEPLNESVIPFKSKRDAFNYINARNNFIDGEVDYGNFDEDNQTTQANVSENELEQKVHRISDIYDKIDQELFRLKDTLRIYDKTSILESIPMEPKMSRLLNYVRDTLNDRHISVRQLEEMSEAFEYIRSVSSSKYILQLIDPWKHTQAKIPSLLPIPSVNFTLRSRTNITSNASGNVAFALNPWYLHSAGPIWTSFAINNDPTLNGLGANNNFIGVDIGQTLPANFYTRYRLVSSAIQITYTSSALNSSGFGAMGVAFQDGAFGAPGAILPGYQNYGTFNTIENSYFLTHSATKSNDNLQLNYIPLDESFTDYQAIDTAKQGYLYIGYLAGQQPNSIVARMDFVMTFEATVDVQYTDYLPCSIYTGSAEDIRVVAKVGSAISQQRQSLTPDNMKAALADITGKDNSVQYDLGPAPMFSKVQSHLDEANDNIKNKIIEKETEGMPEPKKRSFLKRLGESLLDFGVSFLPFGNAVKTGVSMLGKSLFK